MKVLLVVIILCVAQTGWSQNGEPAHPNAPAAAKTLCLCELRVHGTSKGGNIGEFLGGAAGGAIGGASAGGGYYAEFGAEVQQIFQNALSGSKLFQYAGKDNVAMREAGKDLSLAEAAKENHLDWCLKAETINEAAMGFNKKLRMVAKWELVSPDGQKLKIETSVESDDTYGKFPNGADPQLKPAYLKLAKDNVLQFLDKLAAKYGS
jgi:hypothetical protein